MTKFMSVMVAFVVLLGGNAENDGMQQLRENGRFDQLFGEALQLAQ